MVDTYERTLVISLQTIDWVMRIEDDFFPVIAGELGESSEKTEHYKRKLEEYMPTMKVESFLGNLSLLKDICGNLCKIMLEKAMCNW